MEQTARADGPIYDNERGYAVKSEVKPAVAAVVVVVLILLVGFFIYRGASSGGGTKSPGEVGNAGPFAPGNAPIPAAGKPAAADSGSNPMGRPGVPR